MPIFVLFIKIYVPFYAVFDKYKVGIGIDTVTLIDAIIYDINLIFVGLKCHRCFIC